MIEQQPQRQDSLDDQLRDVKAMANRMGCYDAADWIERAMRSRARATPGIVSAVLGDIHPPSHGS